MDDKTNKPKLGKLEKIFPIQDTWSTEPEFSAWLAGAKGLALLGETLGMELDNAETEKSVGPFSADIVCRSAEDGVVVVVENQFGKTDHNHLGKLLTYSAGLESAAIVWIAENFVEQHRAALDWLNAQTVQEVQFFGLEVGLWKIGDSLLAPQFRIVCQPNEWTRSGGGSAKGKSSASPQDALRSEYWEEFLNSIKQGDAASTLKFRDRQHPSWAPIIRFGRTGFSLRPQITLSGIRAELGVPKWAFPLLSKDKEDIANMGVRGEWHEPRGKTGRICVVRSNADVNNREEWPEQHQWLKHHLELLDNAFRRRIADLEEPPDNDEEESEEE